jgi:hypothetical protein
MNRCAGDRHFARFAIVKDGHCASVKERRSPPQSRGPIRTNLEPRNASRAMRALPQRQAEESRERDAARGRGQTWMLYAKVVFLRDREGDPCVLDGVHQASNTLFCSTGARPATCLFRSTDPLPPVRLEGWAASDFFAAGDSRFSVVSEAMSACRRRTTSKAHRVDRYCVGRYCLSFTPDHLVAHPLARGDAASRSPPIISPRSRLLDHEHLSNASTSSHE